MNRLFENFHGYDIQATRRESEEKGGAKRTIKYIARMLDKGRSSEDIANELEEDLDTINGIIEVIGSMGDEPFDEETIYAKWKEALCSKV